MLLCSQTGACIVPVVTVITVYPCIPTPHCVSENAVMESDGDSNNDSDDDSHGDGDSEAATQLIPL